jgi:hypothetical protein
VPEAGLVADRAAEAAVETPPTRVTDARRRRLGLGLIFLGATLVMWRPSPARLATDMFGNIGDPTFTTWVLLWGSHALLSDPLELFDANIFWPNDLTLAYSESLLPLVPIFFVLHLVTGNEVLAGNLLVLGLSFFCLVTAYLFTRRLVGRTDVAVFASLAFSFSGYVSSHLGHIQLWTLGFFPLCFLLLFRLLEERTVRLAIGLGLTSAALFASALYYGAIYLVCVVIIVFGYVVSRRFRPGPRLVRSLLITGLVSAVLLIPILVPYWKVQQDFAVREPIPAYGLRPPDLISPPSNTLVYDDLAETAATRPAAVEHVFFMGFTTLALAAAGVVRLVVATRRRLTPGQRSGSDAVLRLRELWLLGAAGAVSLVLAVGPEVRGVRAPFWYFFEYVPGFAGMRVAARLATPTLLLIAVLAGLGLAWMTERLPRRWPTAVVTGLCLILVVELAIDPVPTQRLTMNEAALDVYEALDDLPEGAVLELPVIDVSGPEAGAAAAIEGPRLIYASRDWNPRFNGYSGYWPPDYVEKARVLSSFPSPESLQLAEELDIRYVIVHVGPSHGVAQLSEEQAQAIVDALPDGATAERHGRAWLVDLGD